MYCCSWMKSTGVRVPSVSSDEAMPISWISKRKAVTGRGKTKGWTSRQASENKEVGVRSPTVVLVTNVNWFASIPSIEHSTNTSQTHLSSEIDQTQCLVSDIEIGLGWNETYCTIFNKFMTFLLSRFHTFLSEVCNKMWQEEKARTSNYMCVAKFPLMDNQLSWAGNVKD